MSMFTVRKPSEGLGLTEGWQSLVIKDAKYGDYNGKKFLDIWFEGLPDKLNLRIYEMRNKTTNEEFGINTVLLYANAPLKFNGMKDSNGNYVVELSENPKDILMQRLNVYLYKDGQYFRIYNKVAPGKEFFNDVVKYEDSDIASIMKSAERNFNEYMRPRLESSGSSVSSTAKSSAW